MPTDVSVLRGRQHLRGYSATEAMTMGSGIRSLRGYTKQIHFLTRFFEESVRDFRLLGHWTQGRRRQ